MKTFIFSFFYNHKIYFLALFLLIFSVLLSSCDSQQRIEPKDEQSKPNRVYKEKTQDLQVTDDFIKKIPNVSILVVKKQEILRNKEFIGITLPVKSQKVYSSIQGIVEEVLVKQNQIVKANQPLYKINTKSTELALQKVKSELKKANADLISMQTAHKQAKLEIETDSIRLVQAESDLERYEQLIDAGAISQQVYEQSISQVDIIKSSITANKALISKIIANINQAKANIDLINDRLKQKKEILQQTTIKAPFSGKVIEMRVGNGQKILDKQKDAYIKIAKTNYMLVDLKLMMDDYLQLKEFIKDKQEVKLTLDNGKVYNKSGVFKFDEVTVNKNLNSKKNDTDIKLQVLFNNEYGQLLSNMKVNASISIHDKTPKILVPLSSIMYFPIYSYKSNEDKKLQEKTISSKSKINGTKVSSEFTIDKRQHFVYILDDKNIVQRRFISLNGLSNKQAIVLDGLKDDDKVIIDSDIEIRPKQKVLVNTHKGKHDQEKNDRSKINE